MRVPRAQKKKRKIWPYILVTFLLLVIGVAGFILYEFKLKQYDVADPVIDKILEEDFVINFPDGEQLIISKDGEIKETASKTVQNTTLDSTSVADTSTNSGSGSTATNSNSGNQNPTGASSNNTQNNTEKTERTTKTKPTQDSITAKYMPTLEALESQATEKVNVILEQAKQEYRTKKSNGENISLGYFYNKYYGAATQLETRTDTAFNSIVSMMEKELENNGYTIENVQTIREQYKATKEARKNTLMNKALELF